MCESVSFQIYEILMSGRRDTGRRAVGFEMWVSAAQVSFAGESTEILTLFCNNVARHFLI